MTEHMNEQLSDRPLPLDEAGAASQRRLALHAARSRHWQQCRRLTMLLLALWLATSFCTAYFARELSSLALFGWPVSFYLAAQGASLIYLAIIGAYAWRMRRLDRRFQQRERESA